MISTLTQADLNSAPLYILESYETYFSSIWNNLGFFHGNILRTDKMTVSNEDN